MLNLQDYIAANPSFKKMTVDDLLFVEYKCPLEEGDLEVWCLPANSKPAYNLTAKQFFLAG